MRHQLKTSLVACVGAILIAACADSATSTVGLAPIGVKKASMMIGGVLLRGETYGPQGQFIQPEINSATNSADTTIFFGINDTVVVNYTNYTFQSCPECGTTYDGGAIFIDARINGEQQSIGRLEADFSQDGQASSNDVPATGTLIYTAVIGSSTCHFLNWDVTQSDNQRFRSSDLVLERDIDAQDELVRGVFQCDS
jgi:hypothetical protein